MNPSRIGTLFEILANGVTTFLLGAKASEEDDPRDCPRLLRLGD